MNGHRPTAIVPDGWKPSKGIQAKLSKALPWISPAIAEIRHVEFVAWADELPDPPKVAQLDRLWLSFMLKTDERQFVGKTRRSFNL